MTTLSRRSLATVLVALAGGAACGEVAGSAPDAAPDAAAAPADAPPAPPPPVLKSCRELHAQQPALPSGKYTIDPDGAGGTSGYEVLCDMQLAGGGWTLVFLPTTLDYERTDLEYTTSST